MITKTQKSAHIGMVSDLQALQADLHREWLARSVPKKWDGLADKHPAIPPKVKVTLRLDRDMVTWYRKLGRGYQSRINAVLRVYWQGLVSGEVQAHWDEEAYGLRDTAHLEDLAAEQLEAARQDAQAGEISAEDLAELEVAFQDVLEKGER